MQPIRPYELTVDNELGRNVTFASNQPEYFPLPAVMSRSGIVLTRWKMTWKERLLALWSGNVWLQCYTFDGRLQPVKLSIEEPAITWMEE